MLTRASAVAFLLVLSTVACASPVVDSPGSTSPEAQATSVRRTAVAEVQRIIAGNLAPNAESVLEVGQRYPDPTGFVVSVPPGADARLTGRTICVTGRIRTAAGTTTMDVRDAAAIVVVN